MKLEGDIVTPQGVIQGQLHIAQGRIAAIAGVPVDAA